MSQQTFVTNRLWILRFQCLLVCLSIIGGCHKADVKDYIPPEEAARQALATALDAWKSGKAPNQLDASNPKIEVQDKQWRDGRKLTSYEIVGPEAGEDLNRRFKVKLTTDGAAAPQETTYVVVGIDPIWVFRQESFQAASGVTSGM